MRAIFSILIFTILVSSCGEYQKVLKSADPEFKYVKAKQYFERREYNKAATIFNELVPVFKGTAKADEVLYYLAESYFLQRNYTMAGHYYQQYAKSFPNTQEAETAYFNAAYCLYMSSPNPRLDQANTTKGIEAFELFLDLYPESGRYNEAQDYISELQDKLVYKSYLNAKLYFDLGNYMGNNYQAAVIAATNSLKDFPDTKYREELSFLILKSKYIQAENSVMEKQDDRYRETIDEYYSFINDFPESKYLKEANKMYTTSQEAVKN